MSDAVASHYAGEAGLEARFADLLRAAGKDLRHLKTGDLASFDEFHIRGRKATLELAGRMRLGAASKVLDIGSGLGGPARTVAETYGCHVTGIDLTPSFCAAAAAMSRWVGLADKVSFQQGDATALPFADASFDAAMTIHVAMNIANKNALYREAKRILKPGAVFAIYDILQGEGGAVVFPVPWAREPSISHLATPAEMRALLQGAGFAIAAEIDSSDESLAWFKELAARMAAAERPAVTFQTFLGADFPEMARNQVQNLAERRIRTVSYICEG
jgi:ubiquinone/menaquinone biosynthesis C-methylase UbiE